MSYYRCPQTGYIQTEDPFWLEEAYSSAITALDLGLLSRNWAKAELTASVVDRCIPEASRYLDFGGGYGIFTRLMRDRGFAFNHFDIYCDNLFARGYELDELRPTPQGKYELITAWEVFEHVADPKALIQQLLSVGDVILFSTELIPQHKISGSDDWWYFTPETGQHISFYTTRALQNLAEQFGLSLYSDGHCNHMFSTAPLQQSPFPIQRSSFWQRAVRKITRCHVSPQSPARRESLLASDFAEALSRLHKDHRGF